MGFGTGLRVPLWAFILTICCIQQKVSSAKGISGKVTIIPQLTQTPVITSFNKAHNGQVCSTWGNFHFKTFDGDIFHFPGLCNYIFASHCNTAFEDFNIQIRRTVAGETVSITYVTMRLDGVDVQLEPDGIMVNGERIELPYSGAGFIIEKSAIYTKVSVKLGLNLMWNEKDNLMMELDEKYVNQTCGLCGDFNGIRTYNEFISNGAHLTNLEFGNMQKMNGPTEDCEDPIPFPLNNCTDVYDFCREVLTGSAFSQCNEVVWVEDYIDICVQDLCFCNESNSFSCACDTFAEYSRQCDHAGGHPENWRTPELCPMTCPFNMQYQECGSPCMDTCTNPERSQLCEEHCVDGCFCPPGTVHDDISGSGCVPLEQCSCIYNGKSYAPGSTYSEPCRSCSCTGGQWDCTDVPCPGICSVEGGSHISTYDEKHYDVHGDCTYVLSKTCDDSLFTVLGELRRCGLTESETCLKMVTLNINGGETTVVIKPNGDVFLNWIYTQLPISAANVTLFRPSSFFIMAKTSFGVQVDIQLVPIMQLYIHLDPSFKERMCGLCGNFDNRETDDFRVLSGVVEGTAAAFANTWKTQSSCPDIKHKFEDPCSLSIENERYANHWCGLLTDSNGPFAKCHSSVNPAPYHKNCMFDTCNCEKSEDCMCAALSSYVRACAAKDIELPGWRTTVCSKYITSCPQSQNYSYVISTCQPTCRSLSEPDVTCNVKFVPVDGCTCQSGTYLDDSRKCVPANKCPCYYKGNPIPSGEVLHDLGAVCTCSKGKLNCIGGGDSKPACAAPMVYFDCKNASAGITGAECQKSCQTLDMHCYSTQCVSGCMCPSGLVSDGKGDCIPMEECPCIHNDVAYKAGEKIKIDCNTCVCKNRMWKCTKNKCLGTCAVYGDGHYITFDDKRYIFNGKCEYTLVQDHCGQNSSTPGTFRIITENVPCGTTGTTCSKTLKIFLGTFELILSEEHHELIQRGEGGHPPYRIRYMGIYLVIETYNGLIILWDRGTSIFIKLSADFKGQVCGLCGNYDGNGINDFTTRSQSVVGDVLEFGNSWKVSPTCPDAKCTKNPCSKNPYRKSWSQKQCSIINSKVFAACHSQVDPAKYYEACVTDSCACDAGGDCECFCTAVAAYAQACSEFGVCISWRSPSICPLFCDYYNADGECDWHYKPCGAPCMKTCRNPSGRCLHHLPGLEGCYPYCPRDKPYFSEDEMRCVDICGCYDDQGHYHPPGKVFHSRETCQSCQCTNRGIECSYNPKACYCYYEGKTYNYKDVIYNTTDGLGWCMTATCDVNGTINRELYKCAESTPTTPFTFTTVSATTQNEAGGTTPSTTSCVHRVCEWTDWYDVSYPRFGPNNGDYETPEKIRARGHNLCKIPDQVECRAQRFPNEKLESLNQKITCTKTGGLICNNKDQDPPICQNYETRFLCCEYTPCGTPTSLPVTSTAAETTAVSKTTLPASSTGSTKAETPGVPGSTATTLLPPTSSPVCQPQCQWTAWFDNYYPSPDIHDGDEENEKTILAAGGKVCENPVDIQCRAEDYPDVSLEELGNKVTCNLQDGMVCLNSEQTGKMKICPNIQARYQCCDYSHCKPGTTAPGFTTAAITTIEGSTPGKSTLPASSTGSTPAPPVPTTTQSTTVVSTGPGVTVSISTPGFTPGKGSTVTATSLHSTSVSTPTESTKPFVTVSIASSSPTVTTASSSSITSTIGITTVTLSRTTPCLCHVSGITNSLYSPGEIIYNRTDSAGCSFYAICNQHCEIERHQGPCPSTTPPRPPTTTPTSPVTTAETSSASKTTVFVPSTESHTSLPVSTTPGIPGCLDINPTRKINETWMLSNCTMATCEGNNRIVVVPLPPPEKIECASGLEPVKIEDTDGCFHYECECICTGWDDSNYMTFDGAYYTFHDNCTYILVKEIVNKHGNFSVLVDNYFCDPTNDQSCSRAIIINYNSMAIVLSSQMHNGVRISQVLFNNKPVNGHFTVNGIIVTSTKTTMTVQIPAINAFIDFNGLTFSVKLPYSLFEHNTEGQCGTCSNDRSDDCRLPSGHEANSCVEMAVEWQVYDKNKPYCEGVTPTPPPTPVLPTPTSCTTPSPLCELIVSDIFVDCHRVLPPKVFYEDCLLEACQSANDSLSCHYVEMYASLCAAKGACTDWRSKSQGKCPYHCPKDKVYSACGLVPAPTCIDGPTQNDNAHVSEGCICSEGKILFNSYSDICVSECGCVGPDGLPKLPGSKWKSNCQECICEPLSVSVQCKPLTCETSKTPVCEKEGFIPVPVLTPEDPCCPEVQCKCNTSACSNKKKSCDPGYELASVLLEGDCCVTFTCEPIPNICLFNETVYKPGTTVPGKPCETCVCGDKIDPASKRNIVECTEVACDTSCPVGHEYQVKAGECCGKCVQVACVITLNGTVELLKPGEIWHPITSNCTLYECEEISDSLVLVNTVRKCPMFDPKECEPDEVELTDDGCCKRCKPPEQKSCKVRKNQTLIRSNDCISTEVIEMTYCEGACPSSSLYSDEARAMQHKCTCCQELKSHRREVTLTCQDGRSISYDYIYVDECQCMTACIPQATIS